MNSLLIVALLACAGSMPAGAVFISCDFDNDANRLCGLVQERNDQFDWTRLKGSTPASNTGPDGDYATGKGYYLYTDARNYGRGARARLESPKINDLGYRGPFCLKMYYHMSGQDVGTLRVYSKVRNQLRNAFAISGNQGSGWRKANVELATDTEKFVIEVETTGRPAGDIAIDNLILLQQSCSGSAPVSKLPNGPPGGVVPLFACSWDTNTRCSIYRDPTAPNFIGGRYPVDPQNLKRGPKFDHTYGTSDGQFGMVDARGPRGVKRNAKLLTMNVDWKNPICLSLWAFMDGSPKDHINVYVKHGGMLIGLHRIKSTNPPKKMWKNVQLDIFAKGKIQLIIEGVVDGTPPTPGVVAVDDVYGYTGPCIQTPGPYDPVPVRLVGGRTREEGRVEVYHQGVWGTVCRDGFDSRAAAVVCGKLGMRPGRTMMLPQYGKPAQKILLDNLMCPEGARELSECQHYGWGQHDCRPEEYARLRCNAAEVYPGHEMVRLANTKHGKNTIEGRVEVRYLGQWSSICDSGWDDQDARVLCNMFGFYGPAVALKGAYHGRGYGDIWLSDFECKSQDTDLMQCKKKTFGVKCGHDRDASVRCTFVPKGLDFICNFERDCDILQDSGDGGDWTRKNMPGQGRAMTINTNHARAGRSRFLLPPVMVMKGSGPQCLRFKYYADDSRADAMHVMMKIGRQKKDLYWVQQFPVTRTWMEGVIQINRMHKYAVIFEAARSPQSSGTIAIDDISLKAGPCAGGPKPPPTVSPTTPSMRPSTPSSTTAKVTPVTSVTTARPGSVISECNFEGDKTCPNFEDDMTKAVFKWTRHNGPTASANTGPDHDHTTGNGKGKYLYIEASAPRRNGDNARLLLPEYKNYLLRCLTFYYHMNGGNIGTLRVLFSDNIKETKLWEKSGQQGNRWLKTSFPAVVPGRYIIEATRGKDYDGDIAIDDIKITAGPCSPGCTGSPCYNGGTCFSPDGNSYRCTCRPEYKGDNCAQKVAGDCRNRPCGNGGVCVTQSGSYYCRCNSGWTGDRCQTRTDVCRNRPCGNNGVCQPQNNGRYNCRCNAGWSGDRCQTQSDVCRNRPCGNNGVCQPQNNGRYYCRCNSGWSGDRCQTQSGVCRNRPCGNNGVCQPQNNGGYSCRCNSGWRGDRCQTKITPGPALLDCNFDDKSCASVMLNRTGDGANIYWFRHKGTTRSGGTGPMYDHTKGRQTDPNNSGYYAYTEATAPVKHGSIARLVSRAAFSGDKPRCLTLWYHARGSHMGALQVKVKDSSGDALLYRIAGHKGADWMPLKLDMYKGGHLVLEGIVGKGYQSDLAIDDIKFVEGVCYSTLPKCTFDTDLCGFYQDWNDKFDWIHGKGPTPTPDTGPNGDHTNWPNHGTGKYLYLEASGPSHRNAAPNENVRLISPLIPGNSDRCLKFWYHMYGSGIGVLNVIKQHPTSSDEATVFTKSGDTLSTEWRQNQTTIYRSDKYPYYRLIFEAKTGSDNKGDISIDDVEITDDGCQ